VKFKNIVIDGVSIIKSILDKKENFKENEADPLLKKFIGWVKICKDEHDPENMVVFLPSEGELSLERIHIITRILKDMGIYSKSINELSIGNSISLSLKDFNGETLISSESILMTQFINEHVSYKKFNNSSIINEKELFSLVGLNQRQIPDLISMIGEPLLSLKTYIGPSFAVSWLKDYRDIEGVISNINLIPRAMRSLLNLNKGNIKMQLKDSDFSNPGLNIDAIDQKSIAVYKENTELLYNSFIDSKLFELLPSELMEKYIPKTNLESIDTYTVEVNDEMKKNNMLSIVKKIGTASIHLSENNVSITSKPGESYYLTIDNEFGKNILKEIMSDSKIKIVSHDTKKLYKWSFSNDIELNSLVSDSAILAYSISTSNSEKDINTLFKDVLGKELESNKSKNEKDDKIRLMGEKSNHLLGLNRALYKKASADKNSRKIFEEIDLPLIKVLSKMEHKGVLLDIELLKSTGSDILLRIEKIQEKVNSVGVRKYDISKSAEISKLLYEDLKLPVLKRTASGAKGTSAEALSGLKDLSDIPGIITEYNGLKKLYSSYITPLSSKVDKNTGRIHCSFLQNVTSTGRLSARDPNLQSIPIRSEYGKKIRQSFIDEKDNYIIAADYSQVELRILAHLSQDEKLIEAFNSGLDIHKATASEIFEVPLDEVTGEQRRCVKSINFGIIYGMSAFGLSKKINKSIEESKNFISKYFEKYPKVQVFLEKTKDFARENGYVLTLMGRKIPCPNINSKIKSERESAERAAINAPMQGTSSDIIKKAMISLSSISNKKGINFDIIMQVHDELVIVSHKSNIKEIHDIVLHEMENAINLDVPLQVDIGVGKNWEKSHSLDDNQSMNHEDIDFSSSSY